MKTSRRVVGDRPVPMRTGFALAALLLCLLLLGSACVAGPGGGEAAPPGPATTSAPPPTASATAGAEGATTSNSPSPAPPIPARRAERSAAVPQYRATLPPVARDRPAPARFSAGSIGVDLPVVATGVTEDGLMQLPESNREVAWYEYGSRPGDPTGTTVLAAHVDTRTEGLGPFARLRELRRGDQLSVTDAKGRTRRYSVTAVDDVPKSRVPLDQLFRRDGPPGLTVLTCGGPFSRRAGYRDNIVVTAQPTR